VVQLFHDRLVGGAARAKARMLPRSGFALCQCLLRAQVVTGGEVLATRGQNHYADRVVSLGAAERLVELNQQAAILRVVGIGRLSQIRAMRPSSRVS